MASIYFFNFSFAATRQRCREGKLTRILFAAMRSHVAMRLCGHNIKTLKLAVPVFTNCFPIHYFLAFLLTSCISCSQRYPKVSQNPVGETLHQPNIHHGSPLKNSSHSEKKSFLIFEKWELCPFCNCLFMQIFSIISKQKR